MADQPDKRDDEDERDQQDDLSDEIARRWDPERLLKLVSRRAGKAERLDLTTRAYFERKLGADLGDVRIYTGQFAEEMTRARGAEALTVGDTGMILMRGSPDRSMATTAGRALLAHELTHVAQAQRGLHRRSTFGEPTPLATEEHELEAEAMEAEEHRAAHGGAVEDEAARREQEQELREAVVKRVLEMVGDNERTRLSRNGDDEWRP